MQNKKLFNIVSSAIITAFIAVCAQIVIPLPTGLPITLQTFAVCLCGFLLGFKWGTASTAVYIFLGLIGIPVFSSFGSGFGVLAGPTGGFLLGFLPLSFCCGLTKTVKKRGFKIILLSSSLIFFHFLGLLHYSIVTKTPFISAFVLCSAPFILKDIISAVLALFVAVKLQRNFS